jgi:16S rRNA (cytidine1402-2'-O)-methyltransferase
MATLYIVATPLGNLEDISRRAERVLREVDSVVSEDTRVTGKLLHHLGIQKPMLAYHARSSTLRTVEIIDLLRQGKNLALVSDAGTPGINDPGGKLVERVARELGQTVTITPVPGPSTVATALSVSGFPAERFRYLGFPPHKKGRPTFFRELAALPETIVFLESPYRILKALEALAVELPGRELAVMRELTKLHETIYRGTPREVTNQLKNDTVKGEFVVVIRSL